MNKHHPAAKYINVHVVFPIILYVIQLLIIPLQVTPTLYPSMHHKWLTAYIQMPNPGIWCSICLYTPPSDIGGAVQDRFHEEELLDVVPDSGWQIDHVDACCLLGSGVLIANLRKKFQFFYL